MRVVPSYLAKRRWAAVGLALLAELLLLFALSLAPPSATLGIPAAVAAAVAGTVAVVFGIADGIAVAATGALLFAALGGWGAGEVSAIAVWPLIVAAVGLFARRVDSHRVALRRLVEAQEDERRALALALHDDSAQTLTGALLTLRSGIGGSDAAAAETLEARELIVDTIRQLRRLALELSPKALEDHGVAAALAHLVETQQDRLAMAVTFVGDWEGRLSRDAEWALFRFAQAALTTAEDCGASRLTLRLACERGRVVLTATATLPAVDASPPPLPAALEERFRLLDGRASATASGGEVVLRADVPAQLRALDGVAAA